MNVNKFSMGWQLTRVNARSIKDVDEKIKYVVGFLNKNKNIHNYERVLNWLRMTKLGYSKYPTEVTKFIKAVDMLARGESEYSRVLEDDHYDLSEFSTADIEKVLKDLENRKYGFQFNGVPRAHVVFVKQLKDELERREQ